MNMLHFEWDPQKDLTNQKKHGVSFAEASTVFEDVNALVISDPEHSEDEERTAVKKEYDFSNARKNPYADKVKQQITINLNQSTVQYFKDLAEKAGLPYQTLINLYLTDCADKKRQPEVNWIPA